MKVGGKQQKNYRIIYTKPHMCIINVCACMNNHGIIPEWDILWYSMIYFYFSEHDSISQRSKPLNEYKLRISLWREAHQELKELLAREFYSFFFFFLPYPHSGKQTAEPSSCLKCREHKYLFYFLISVFSIAIGYLQHVFVILIISSHILWQ